MVGQLAKLVGATNWAYCLQLPVPPAVNVPSVFLLELTIGHCEKGGAFPQVVVTASIFVTCRGRSLVFWIEKLKAPPALYAGYCGSSGMSTLLASAIPASTRRVMPAAWPST